MYLFLSLKATQSSILWSVLCRFHYSSPFVVTRCDSLSLVVSLVVTRCTIPLSFYKRSCWSVKKGFQASLIILRKLIKSRTSGTLSDNEWQRMTMSDNDCYNEWQRMTASDKESFNDWQRVVQRVAMNDNEWQRMTTSDNEWYNKWQRATTSDTEWRRMAMSDTKREQWYSEWK